MIAPRIVGELSFNRIERHWRGDFAPHLIETSGACKFICAGTHQFSSFPWRWRCTELLHWLRREPKHSFRAAGTVIFRVIAALDAYFHDLLHSHRLRSEEHT